jgi:hypothetical protein
LLLQDQLFEPTIERWTQDLAALLRAEDHVILTAIDDGMIGIVFLVACASSIYRL